MIISVFNAAWFLLLIISAMVFITFTALFLKADRKVKLKFVQWLSTVTFVFWFFYKLGLFLDPEYDFVFWKELPLQPCNTIMWLSIIAAKNDNKPVMSYIFYFGSVCALMALVMPETGFYDIPLGTIKAIGFYGTHWMIVVISLLYVTLGLVDISYKNALMADIVYIFMSIFMHFVNFIIRISVYPETNYFYTFGNEDNSILNALRQFIPVNLLYLLPVFIACAAFFMFTTWVFKTPSRQKARREAKEATA